MCIKDKFISRIERVKQMKIKQGYEAIKKSIWLYPVFYSVLALLLAAVVVLLDNGYLFDMRPYLPERIFSTRSRELSGG